MKLNAKSIVLYFRYSCFSNFNMDKTRTVKKTATVYVQLNGNGNAVSLHI